MRVFMRQPVIGATNPTSTIFRIYKGCFFLLKRIFFSQPSRRQLFHPRWRGDYTTAPLEPIANTHRYPNAMHPSFQTNPHSQRHTHSHAAHATRILREYFRPAVPNSFIHSVVRQWFRHTDGDLSETEKTVIVYRRAHFESSWTSYC